MFAADADALMLCAFAYSGADEAAATGLEHGGGDDTIYGLDGDDSLLGGDGLGVDLREDD